MTLTLDKMRADVAELIDLDPSEIGDDDILPDLGLDSLRLMRLVLAWEEAGLKADFGLFAEYATLGDWWREVVQPAQAA
ncbi:phosphopantetheine-binding protein [Paracoccus siganidrum]|uniref:Phosphopantetheine-binding protein n=1 Tax=Paracoccus siganidrum TaxID=1276757 RepID=A0A419A5R6_9RHOB|nr:phosphopantetheine-binding protein [Paracoccus siganidrum]RJL11894.1 phosphopantetheine-binding protein [Paracoccus siganidrum]RMC35899.1 phosphopantetheine-binding protein [Paracoccus siganidrum]